MVQVDNDLLELASKLNNLQEFLAATYNAFMLLWNSLLLNPTEIGAVYASRMMASLFWIMLYDNRNHGTSND
jgi:hypothetical protein